MCGGRGTRLAASVEKPLVPVCGEPMLDRVARALRASAASPVYAVASPHAPETRAHAADLGLDVVDAPGEGYVADLRHAVDAVGGPVVTCVADLPGLAPGHVDRAIEVAAGADVADPAAADADPASLTVCVPVDLKRSVGASVDTAFDHAGRRVAPTGLNVVAPGGTETVSVVDDERLAVNVNRPRDLEVARSLCD
jgi:adenosylcobinamide-phosphate guanylyltransferase